MSDVVTKLSEHADAPKWNHATSDHLTDTDREALTGFAESLASERRAHGAMPSPELVGRLCALWPHVPRWRSMLPTGFDLQRDWAAIPTSSRADLALHPETMFPDTADLSSLIVYCTAGTTGHTLRVPHAARAAAAYQPLIAQALVLHGVTWAPGANDIAAFNVGAQLHTVTYPTTLSFWGGAGFAKVNLRDWTANGRPERYFADMAPMLLTGDPISFSEMLRMGIPARPVAMVSTAVAMSRVLREKLSAAYGCPVIDWYSLTETGPIGYLCRIGEGYHVLPHDIGVEILGVSGEPLREGQRGEVTVSGGRNPFLPMLRYRTGDYGHLDNSTCACGDPTPRLCDLEGRVPVMMRAADGSFVNPVDFSRILRAFPFVQHELTQRADGSCELVVRPLAPFDEAALRVAMAAVLGAVPLQVRIDRELGNRTDGKVMPYRSEWKLED